MDTQALELTRDRLEYALKEALDTGFTIAGITGRNDVLSRLAKEMTRRSLWNTNEADIVQGGLQQIHNHLHFLWVIGVISAGKVEIASAEACESFLYCLEEGAGG